MFEDDWVDAQEMHKENPDTFWVPTDLHKIRKRHYVKISNGKERFWVKVLEVNGREVIGIICDMLICGSEYNMDDYVKFELRHVHDLYK